MSTKKINEILGISNIDTFLNDLDIKDPNGKSLSEIDRGINDNVQQIDSQILEYQKNGIANINVTNIESSLCEIKDLIDSSKTVVKHVLESIITTEMVDAELVSSLGKIVESTHLAIKTYIDVYNSRMNFYDKVRLEQLKQQHKLEQMEIKHKHDMEKLNSTKRNDSVPVQNMMAYSQEKIVGELNDQDKQN